MRHNCEAKTRKGVRCGNPTRATCRYCHRHRSKPYVPPPAVDIPEPELQLRKQPNRRIGGDRRRPRRFLIGWAPAPDLQRVADDLSGGMLQISHVEDNHHPFPVYVEDPPR